MEDAMKTTEEGRKMIEEADKRGGKHFETLGEKVAEDERGATERRSRSMRAKMKCHKRRQEIAKAS